jgi:hypothetical protein
MSTPPATCQSGSDDRIAELIAGITKRAEQAVRAESRLITRHYFTMHRDVCYPTAHRSMIVHGNTASLEMEHQAWANKIWALWSESPSASSDIPMLPTDMLEHIMGHVVPDWVRDTSYNKLRLVPGTIARAFKNMAAIRRTCKLFNKAIGKIRADREAPRCPLTWVAVHIGGERVRLPFVNLYCRRVRPCLTACCSRRHTRIPRTKRQSRRSSLETARRCRETRVLTSSLTIEYGLLIRIGRSGSPATLRLTRKRRTRQTANPKIPRTRLCVPMEMEEPSDGRYASL